MFHLVLYQPEIPPNTGNAMRLAANTGVTLHLVGHLGFEMDDARLRRAGMDYRDRATVVRHADIQTFHDRVGPARSFALTKAGRTCYTDVAYRPGDALILGPESVGLPKEVLELDWIEDQLYIPMRAGVRSLNLSNAAAIVTFEAWRQVGFAGSDRGSVERDQ